jgi:uncharacterized protein YneR
VELEDGGVNYYRKEGSLSGVNEVDFYINHGGNID